MAVQTCSVMEARQRLEQGSSTLLDVREYPEYVEAHLAGGKLVPLGELRAKPELAGRGGEVLILCRSGRRATEAAELLERYGGVQPVVIEGGIEAWKQAGQPVRSGKGPISLERQVRIAAGTLVATGILLDPILTGARYLALFVGVGLIFAGVTNSCGMGLLLAKAPWNRRSPGSVADPSNPQSCPSQ